MDKLFINDLTLHGYHGVLPEETVLGQPYITSVIFEFDASKAGISDALEATIDYRKAIAIVEKVVTGPPLKLIEAIAERIAHRLLEELPLAQAVTVRLTKPRPPVAAHFSGATIEIHRRRESQ